MSSLSNDRARIEEVRIGTMQLLGPDGQFVTIPTEVVIIREGADVVVKVQPLVLSEGEACQQESTTLSNET